MKRTLWIIACCFVAQLATAQAPKWAEKARKAVFSIVTYDKDNQIKGTGNGFYINMQGTALSDYALFEGASRATIITADGNQKDVLSIHGANWIYDIVKFRTSTDKKQASLTIASQPAKVGDLVYLLPYSTQKSKNLQTGRVTAVDSIGNNSFYYTLEMNAGEKFVSCPIMNANGEVLGMIQKNTSDNSKESYAIGASYGESLTINVLSMNDGTLNNIGIKKGLPDTEEQALVFLYMLSSQNVDSNIYLSLLNDFIQLYPNNSEGYLRRASYYMFSEKADEQALAEEDLKQSMKVATNQQEANYQAAKAIYNYALSLEGKEGNPEWTYDRALVLVREANKMKEEGIYLHLEGDILFAQAKYDEASLAYEKVNRTSIASVETYYSFMKAKQLEGKTDINGVLALMDSTIAQLKKPYFAEAAPYFYERAGMCVEAGKFREAVMDYNMFHKALSGEVTALFYFQREQAAIQCRMYQQALDDINKAVEMAPEEAEYWTEKGAVHLRVNQLDEAIAAFSKSLTLDDKQASVYRMLGYCQALQKKKKEACANFAKAKELGDEVVDQLIEKYCK